MAETIAKSIVSTRMAMRYLTSSEGQVAASPTWGQVGHSLLSKCSGRSLSLSKDGAVMGDLEKSDPLHLVDKGYLINKYLGYRAKLHK